MRVFLVDDSAVLRSRLRESIAHIPGVTVVGEAGEAGQALAGIRAAAPDVVVLDAVFPGGGARFVLRGLRQLERPPTALMLTNHAEPEYRTDFLRLGASGFFDKALQFEQLLDTLRAMT